MENISYLERYASASETREKSYYSAVARITFFTYMFFIFFGTTMPFGVREVDPNQVGNSNPANQIIFSTLFLISAGCLLVKRRELWEFILREKFLTIFLVWCFFTIFWSDYSFVSFKRWFQILCTYTVSLAFLLDLRHKDEFLVYFKWLLYVYIILTFLSIILIPGAMDPKHHTWRGLTVGKNFLGQTAVICILFWTYILKSTEVRGKIAAIVMLLLSVVLLFGAQSMSAIVTFLILLFLVFWLLVDKLFEPLGVGRVYSSLVIVSTIVVVGLVYFLAPEFVDAAFKFLGKDSTFTGRTDLWMEIFRESKEHLILGCGFSGYWIDNSDALYAIYREFIWLPNEAHMGYLEILNETGIIGSLIFILMLMGYFVNLANLKNSHFGKWFIIAVLILNLQESTLFRQNVMTGVIFIFFYLVLYRDMLDQEKSDSVFHNLPGKKSNLEYAYDVKY